MTPAAPPETALVAEDDEDSRRFFVEQLTGAGFSVEAVANGYAACERLGARKYDLLITDIVLPGATGFQVLAAAQASDPETICLALTSFGSLDTALEALSFGAYSFLLKPCDGPTFLHCVQRGIEKRRLTKELRARNEELAALNRSLDAKVQEATQSLQELNRRVLTEMASLKEVGELKSAFLRNVTHDLRSPITGVLGFLGLLKEGELSASQARLVANARNAAGHLDYLIKQLVQAATLEAGKLELAKETVAVERLLEDAAGLFHLQAKDAGVSLSTRCEPGLAVQADRGHVLQVLSNLIGNACKFTPPGGRVEVSAAGGPPARFCVADTGPGIAPEHRGRIFEKFYQVDASPNKAKGLGLGLRIAKDIVEQHGGRLWLESAPGQGSRFFFELP